jgi:putative ABC transport system permease protein
LTFKILGYPDLGNTPDERAAARAAFMHQIDERLRAIPGVQSAGGASPFPLAGGFSPIRWGTDEALSDASKFQAADDQIVRPGYFETMHTPVLSGRTFTEDDNTLGRNLVVIDQLLAEKAFPNQSAVGKRILIRLRTPEPEWVEVIGVVAHVRDESLADRGREQIYFADAFLSSGAINQWVIRTQNEPAAYGGDVRAALKALDPHMLIVEMQPVDALVDKAQASTRFSLLLIGVFAVIAALLAAVGLYGVLATIVRQRTAEIGIRMALGAQPARIFRLVVGQALRLTAAGVAVGLVTAFALTRGMNTMLVGVKATDPSTFATIAVLFFLIAVAASWLPAWRAASLDPTAALRDE